MSTNTRNIQSVGPPSEMCKINLLREPISFVVSFLLQWTPLHIAAGEGRCEDILKSLVGKGANLNIKDNNGVNIM